MSDAGDVHHTTFSLNQIDALSAEQHRIRLRTNLLCQLFSDEDEFANCPLREELADVFVEILDLVEEAQQILEQGERVRTAGIPDA
jgi:hypothetical protein